MTHEDYKELNAVKMYRSVYTAAEKLPDDMMLKYYKAIMRYTFDGIEPDFGDDFVLDAVFEALRPNIDNANKAALSGKRGGLNKGSENPSQGSAETLNNGFENPSQADIGNRKEEIGNRKEEIGREKEEVGRKKEESEEGTDPAPDASKPAGDIKDFSRSRSLSIILKDGTVWTPSEKEIQAFKKDYPNVNIEKELSFMAAWSEKAPEKRWTKKSRIGHVIKWLDAEAERARSGTRSAKAAYTAFPQRDYDFEDLEKQILTGQEATT